MAWTVKISKAARQDIQEIKQWYREQSYQAMKDFTDELHAAIETLKEDFINYRRIYKNQRRLSLKKFLTLYTIVEKKKKPLLHKQRQSSAFNDRIDNEE